MNSPYTVTIPADVEREDRLVANLTARQLVILIPAAVAVWALYLATDALVPLPVFAALAIPIIGVAAALALVERDGTSLDRLALHALQHARQPRRLVVAPEGIPALPAWATASGHVPPLPAPLRLPTRAIRADGAINLGADGIAVVVACSTVSFALRTSGEQAALVGAFGGWLNALTGPAQILVHAQPINLAPAIMLLHERATGLPHPALEEAALDHARFLTELAATRELLARQVLIVLREPYGPTETGSGGRARRDAEVRRRGCCSAGNRPPERWPPPESTPTSSTAPRPPPCWPPQPTRPPRPWTPALRPPDEPITAVTTAEARQ